MIRSILIFIFILVIYAALKTLYRSARKGYRGGEKHAQIKGQDMVLDPACRTYVLKERALARRVHGKLTFFCSEACAQTFEKQNRV